MLFNYLFLAFCVSIDSLGIGITYGLKNTRLSLLSKIILFALSLFFTFCALSVGTILSNFLPENASKMIGAILLIFMGLWIFYQSFHKSEDVCMNVKMEEEKVFRFFIQSLGITIQIIRNPISSDFDHSKQIESKEAFFLGIALSIDSFGIGVGSSIMGVNSILFPLLVAIFQLFFLSFGSFIGKKITASTSIPKNIWNQLSGLLLILIGVLKLF